MHSWPGEVNLRQLNKPYIETSWHQKDHCNLRILTSFRASLSLSDSPRVSAPHLPGQAAMPPRLQWAFETLKTLTSHPFLLESILIQLGAHRRPARRISRIPEYASSASSAALGTPSSTLKASSAEPCLQPKSRTVRNPASKHLHSSARQLHLNGSKELQCANVCNMLITQMWQFPKIGGPQP